MLEKYQVETTEELNRLEVVRAALEIAKAAVGSATAMSGIKSGHDIDFVTKKIGALADAIQAALEDEQASSK